MTVVSPRAGVLRKADGRRGPPSTFRVRPDRWLFTQYVRGCPTAQASWAGARGPRAQGGTVGVFRQQRQLDLPANAQEPPAEHAVIANFTLAVGGSAGHARRVAGLERQLRFIVWLRRAGELDGSMLGPDLVKLFAYGPDADRLFAVMEPTLRRFPARPAHVTLRYGTANDSHAQERRVDL